MYDAIIIGGGVGALSTACFLAREGWKVLILEKENKAGGLVTSFSRNGVQFDLGLEGIFELKEKETIDQFIHFWGEQLETRKRSEDDPGVCRTRGVPFARRDDGSGPGAGFSAGGEGGRAVFRYQPEDSWRNVFGEKRRSRLFEMSLFQKFLFGVKTAIQRPTFMKYGMRNASKVLRGLFGDKRLMNIIYAKSHVPDGLCGLCLPLGDHAAR